MSNKKALQQQLASKYNKENLGVLLEPMKESLITPALDYVKAWLAQPFDYAKRPDLIEVVSAVHDLDAEEICWSIMTKVLLDESITLQACMGMFFNQIGKYVPMAYRRGHVLNVYVQAVCATKLIDVKHMGKYNNLVAVVSMGDRGQRDYSYTLPSVEPHHVKSNKQAAYEHMHVITGGKHKQHNEEVCLDHIDRLSRIPYKVEPRIFDMTKPVFEDTPKYKENIGRFETDEEVCDREKEFKRFERELPTRVKIMLENGNEFYYGHRYDVRLRTYLKAYHFDFIGNKYARAFVQPKNGELVSGANEYI